VNRRRTLGLTFATCASLITVPRSAAAEEAPISTTQTSRVEARGLGAQTVETLIADERIRQEELRAQSSRKAPTKPFVVRIPRGRPCRLYSVLPLGQNVPLAAKPTVGPDPGTGKGPVDRDEVGGEWHTLFLVDPTVTDPTTGRWKRSMQAQPECIPTPQLRNDTSAATGSSERNEIRELFSLPRPILATGASSAITGAPLGIWDNKPSGPTTFPATHLNGKTIELEATPTSYEWDTGDSGTAALQTRYVTPGPGSAEQPAVTHVYETKSSVGRPAEGVYTITLTVRWERRYRVIGITDPCNDWCLLDPGETTATLPYQVGEVRAVLVD
jgi:hypothetical protein